MGCGPEEFLVGPGGEIGRDGLIGFGIVGCFVWESCVRGL